MRIIQLLLTKKRIKDFATGKSVLLTPEEEIRQEYESILVESYGYHKTDIDIEAQIPRGSGYFSDEADIVVYNGQGREVTKDIIGIVETKRPTRTDGIEQLKSYMTATSALWESGRMATILRMSADKGHKF